MRRVPDARNGAGALLVALVLAVLLAGCGSGSDSEAAGTADGAGVELPEGLAFSTDGWRTDFAVHSVPLEEIISGGPPRDGIPPIDEPRFEPASATGGRGTEPVLAVEVRGVARAYPLRILIWHEIVNDTIVGLPVAVTFCPLCNTGIVFERVVDGHELRFGTTGNLRLSDLVMWDDRTESWWQQFDGTAIVGEMTGATLRRVPSRLISLGEFRGLYPEGEVLTEDTGHDRPYGRNPYGGYDEPGSAPFLLRGAETDGRLAPKERVVLLDVDNDTVVVPFGVLTERRVVMVDLAGGPAVVWWREGTASALDDAEIARGRDVGSVVVFRALVDGRPADFSVLGPDALRDDLTGSRWTRDGRAVGGPARGARLDPVHHDIPFWFSVAAFRPEARIITG
ncbi:MAG: DUF3179 domain-containing protein [Miltoncostaeaceae bacterium]